MSVSKLCCKDLRVTTAVFGTAAAPSAYLILMAAMLRCRPFSISLCAGSSGLPATADQLASAQEASNKFYLGTMCNHEFTEATYIRQVRCNAMVMLHIDATKISEQVLADILADDGLVMTGLKEKQIECSKAWQRSCAPYNTNQGQIPCNHRFLHNSQYMRAMSVGVDERKKASKKTRPLTQAL